MLLVDMSSVTNDHKFLLLNDIKYIYTTDFNFRSNVLSTAAKGGTLLNYSFNSFHFNSYPVHSHTATDSHAYVHCS